MTSNTTLPPEQQKTVRSLADHDDLPLLVVGDPAGLHFRFHPNGRLHSLRSGPDFLVNLLFGCPLAGGLHRLYVEIEQAGRRDVVFVIGAGSRAEFSADDDQAMWRVEQGDIAIAAILVPDPMRTRWSLEVSLENRGADAVRWCAFHGLDVGLASPSAARINEAYVSQYIDHKAFDHQAFGKVIASRQNLAVNGKHPLLLQACLGGCSEFATDARDVFGGAIARSEPLPSCLQAGRPPLPGIRQGESSYVALRSKPATVPSGGESRCCFVGIYADDHPEPSSAKCLDWLEEKGSKPGDVERASRLLSPFQPQAGKPVSHSRVSRDRDDWGASPTKRDPCSATGNAALSIFDLPRVVHGEAMDEQELKTLFPGDWDVVERSPGGDLWSFFTGDDARHVVTRAKESVMARPHATILRSGGGLYPQPDQMTTTCFAAGVFNSLLSSGHPSFHRLLNYPRESLGLIATAGQRIWIRDQYGWLLLGVPSFFEMGLADIRWCYRLPGRTVEVRVAVDPQQSRCRLDVRVSSGILTSPAEKEAARKKDDPTCDGGDASPRRPSREVGRLGEPSLPMIVSPNTPCGPAAEFLVTHGLIGGINEYDEPAELEIDHRNAFARVRASEESPFRKLDKLAAFKIAVDDPSGVAEIGGAECLEGGSPNHAMLVVRTKMVSRFGMEITVESCACGEEVTPDLNGSDFSPEGATSNSPGQASAPPWVLEKEGHCPEWAASQMSHNGDWLKMAASLHLRGGSDAVSRLNRCLPWFVHNAMIHFSVPHGIEQYNGGAWGTRDVTQGSVEMLLALGCHEACRKVLLDIFSHQYEGGHQWPQWFMLDPFGSIQQSHCHGDIPLWPLKALCDYLEASADFGILDEQVAWTRYKDGSLTDRRSPLAEHLEDSLAWLRSNCSPGTALLRYKDGDWDDSLQPAKPEFRERLISSWTVALCYQVLRRIEEVCRRSGRTMAGLNGFADDVCRDFHRFLVIDGVVCGFFLFDADSAVAGQPLLHPSDRLTGIHYRLIPMTRAMLAGLFTPEEAERHCLLIAEHLLAADGARLMDRPPTYKGGISEIFQRAESSSCFSREIGIMYVHAHLRYIEAMACMGKADAMLEAFNKANPAGLSASVPHALPRQANAYFSSSDAAVATRYEASARYEEIKSGKMPVEGGWRIYSSGPGIFLHLVLTRMAGLRRYYDKVVLDPVLPRSLDGFEVQMPWRDRLLTIRFSVKAREHTPQSATLNGTPLAPLALSTNPYRSGGWLLDAAHFDSLLKKGENLLEVSL